MPVYSTRHGLAMTAAGPEAVTHYDDALSAYLRFRRDTGAHLKASLQADPGLLMGHCTKGYFFQLFCNKALAARAQAALQAAQAAAEGRGTQREHMHIDALAAWCEGDWMRATACWEQILALHPRDVLALRLAHFTHFYLGRPQPMHDSTARVLGAWNPDIPDYGIVLGVYAFGLEETGDYTRAEAIGREALARDPTDIWAVHAVAHVMEMQGRQREGMAWLEATEPGWRDTNNFNYHVWWHRCLFHLELEQYDEVLALYDTRVRADQRSDDYLDIANAASLLWRLEGAGVSVAERWHELADKSAARGDDHVLAFADAHFMMALAADGRAADAERMLASVPGRTDAVGTQASILAEVGRPLCEGLLAYCRGEYGQAVERLLPIRARIIRIGGSHTQRDVFEQLLIQAMLKAGRFEPARALLGERTARRPNSAWSWKRYADVLEAFADETGARAARARAATLLAA